MKASIVIPNLNGAGWLRGSIESLYAMDEQDFELIVVDNGSTDESLAIAKEFEGRDSYTLIQNGENTGFSHAVNQGIRAAKAPYVLLFNNDAFAKPDMLTQLLQTVETDKRIFAVQPLMLQHWAPELADDAGDYVTIFGWALKRGDGFKAARYQKPGRIFSACGGASLYRKSAFEEIGLFDETFFAYSEDVDISWRANSLGYKCLYQPAAQCTHICGATTGGEKGARYNDFKSVQSGRNSLLLVVKNQPVGMLVLNFLPMAFGYLLKTLVFTLRGYRKSWCKGMKEGFALLGRMKKPKFRWKNLPHYAWVEVQLLWGTLLFIEYRARKLFAPKK